MSATVENPGFFVSNVANIHSLRARIQRNPDESGLPEEFLSNLNSMLGWMTDHASSFDENCALNIDWIGNQFRSTLINLNDGVPTGKIFDKYFDLFSMAYRFLSEYSFNSPGEPSAGFLRVEEYVSRNLDSFLPHHKEQLVYTSYFMPARMTKEYLDEFKKLELSGIRQSVKKWDEVVADWNKNLDEREARVNALEVTLKNQRSEYNFVGLVDGFKTLKERKSKEQAQAFKLLLIFGGAMLAIPILQVFFVIPRWDHNLMAQDYLKLVLPALAFELILFYFFRIVLRQYNSVTAQLLQLDLRISLCQFIESYTEHMMKVKAKDPGVLQKFESLIFSGLMTDGEKIPSVLDGTEQIANLIRSWKQGN